MARKSLRERYRGAFFSGLAALLPTILTIFVLTFCFNFLNDKIAQPINRLIENLLSLEVAKAWYWDRLLHLQPWQLDESDMDLVQARELGLERDVPFTQMVHAHVPRWLGFVLALALVLVVGVVFRGYIGRQVWRALERGILRLPVLKVIYPYAKQVTEFFFAEKKAMHYDSAVAIEYPRKGIWALGFVTSEGFLDIAAVSGEEMVSVFIPSSPTPVTGYTIVVKRTDLVRLKVTVDEALRFVMSAGVIQPPSQVQVLELKTRRLSKQLDG